MIQESISKTQHENILWYYKRIIFKSIKIRNVKGKPEKLFQIDN